jgi:hypothetical protein
MRFVRRLTSKIGMRGKRHTNKGERRAAVEKLQRDLAIKRERWHRRTADQIGTYVGAVQSASQVARKHVAEQLRKGLHAVRSVQPIGAGQLINLLVKHGVVGWQAARETKEQAAPDVR